jgi:hypothetical protein
MVSTNYVVEPKKKLISLFQPHYAHKRGQAIASTRNETKKMMEGAKIGANNITKQKLEPTTIEE